MNSEIRLVDETTITLDELSLPDLHGTPRVMTLLREKLLNPEDVPEELLYLKDKSGASALDLCIERFKEPVPIKNDNKTDRVIRILYLVTTQNEKGEYLFPHHFRSIKKC